VPRIWLRSSITPVTRNIERITAPKSLEKKVLILDIFISAPVIME
jgi:hypothetical protein